MNKPNEWDNVEAYSNKQPKLGYYILQIKNAVEGYSKNSGEPILRIDLDILDGDFKDFYSKLSQKLGKNMLLQYNQLTEKKEALPFFKKIVEDIEKSNYGYIFDFNPGTLRGKKVGAYLQEFDYESKKGIRKYLKVDRFYPVGEIRERIGEEIVNNLESTNSKTEENTETKNVYDDLPF